MSVRWAYAIKVSTARTTSYQSPRLSGFSPSYSSPGYQCWIRKNEIRLSEIKMLDTQLAMPKGRRDSGHLSSSLFTALSPGSQATLLYFKLATRLYCLANSNLTEPEKHSQEIKLIATHFAKHILLTVMETLKNKFWCIFFSWSLFCKMLTNGFGSNHFLYCSAHFSRRSFHLPSAYLNSRMSGGILRDGRSSLSVKFCFTLLESVLIGIIRTWEHLHPHLLRVQMRRKFIAAQFFCT